MTPLNSGGIYVSGYLNRSNITTQPFAAEDIVVVYDGYCASTCTIFSELMTTQGHVKTIALGGRPNKDIIQAVGGVKGTLTANRIIASYDRLTKYYIGTNDFPYSYILYGVELPFKIQHYHDADYYNTTALGAYSDLPLWRSTDSVVNARDGIGPHDPTQTPLQFIYQPADCRIYYTADMIVDETAVWKTVADVAFKGQTGHCVAGNYGSGGGKMKREVQPRTRHAARRDINIAEHFAAMAETWRGRGSVALGGDGFMLP